MRWLFHVLLEQDIEWGADGRYRARSLETEGFVHASYRETVHESARLYFPPDAKRKVLAIDPRRLDVPVEIASTPRGPMPHIRGLIPADAIRVISLEDVDAHPDRVSGTRIGFLAFEGLTLLDLVGPLDALARIASMGFDAKTTCEVVALTRPDTDSTSGGVIVWEGWGAKLVAQRYRPALDAFDLLVVPGGPITVSLAQDPAISSYIASYPDNRLLASVCTGALLLGAAGRLKGKRATTHASALGALPTFGATIATERVVDEGNLVTAGGVTAGIDLGLYLVRRLHGDSVADAIADRMELRR